MGAAIMCAEACSFLREAVRLWSGVGVFSCAGHSRCHSS